MDSTFGGAERLYRAVYPPSHPGMYWKKDGRIKSIKTWILKLYGT